MAITRTPIFDDSGTGTDGTVLNNAWKQELYDQIDGAVVGGVAPPQTPAGGTVNDLAITNATATIRIGPTAPVIYTGFAMTGVADGQQLLIQNLGPASLRIAHDDAGSAAANRVLAVSVRGQILGVGGAVLLVYASSAARWRMYLVTPGAPISIPFSAADFTASAGTWTVDGADVPLNQYTQEGSFLSWWFRFAQTSVSNAGVNLRVALPNGFSSGPSTGGNLALQPRVSDAGAASVLGLMYPGLPSATVAQFFSTQAGNLFGVATNTTEIQGFVRFPIA